MAEARHSTVSSDQEPESHLTLSDADPLVPTSEASYGGTTLDLDDESHSNALYVLSNESNASVASRLKYYESFSYTAFRRWLFRCQNLQRYLTLDTLKILVIFCIVLFAAFMFTGESENEGALPLHAVSRSYPYTTTFKPRSNRYLVVDIHVQKANWGTMESTTTASLTSQDESSLRMHLAVSKAVNHTWVDVGKTWTLHLSNLISTQARHRFDLGNGDHAGQRFQLNVSTNSNIPLGMILELETSLELVKYDIIYAAVILVGVYVLIVFEVMHRTLAAMTGAFVALAALSKLYSRPTLLDVVTWIDFDTVGLLFGMMIMVGIFSTTGFFEWMAIRSYKLSRGNLWILTIILCFSTAFISAFLDNVTTVLLLTPVTLRLCKVMDVDPIPIVLAEVLFSNIGGTATAIGDPPNVIIVSDTQLQSLANISFTNFALHMTPGVLLALFGSFYVLRYFVKSSVHREPQLAKRKELEIWERTLRTTPKETEDDLKVRAMLSEYVEKLRAEVNDRTADVMAQSPIEMDELLAKYEITDVPLFVKSCVVLAAVILLFFLHSVFHIELSLAWIAIIGAMIHLLVSGIRDIEEVLEKVELGTLMFFAALFILMEALEEMGLISFIADQVAALIGRVPHGLLRECAAVSLILWSSAVVSACIDNIPYTTAMIPIIVTLVESDLDLPALPLILSLAFGTCLGGNGTLVGASANVVACGIADAEGFHISFTQFSMLGAPLMFVSVAIVWIYLLVFHVFIPWY